jgi:GAF domain-containing protein
MTVHDTARRREWDEYRLAAGRAQAALQQAADEARQRLAALESLTDPALNPMGGTAMVADLLERLRATVGADGVALTQPGRVGAGVFAAGALQPVAGPIRPAGAPLAAGRVAVVQNDSAQVERQSGLRWPAGVTSLLVVPIVHNGQVCSTIEVVSERSRPVSDWDVALARIVADRLAPVVVRAPGLAATGS